MAGIYIHIPFCKQACHYCDFHFSTSLTYKDEMMNVLKKELRMQKAYLSGEEIQTIYFGGGTPSLLPAAALNTLTDEIFHLYPVAANAEITMEANPDDLSQQQVKELRTTPVNRFSIGIQSFYDEDLKWMNRAHRASEAEASVKRVQDAGFGNITIDLIYGYPLLSDEKWKSNIRKALDLEVPHISSYSLTVEPKTALAHMIKAGKERNVDDEQAAAQFERLMAELADAGFIHYEISNFCKEGHHYRHNSNYWKGAKYLGIGPSAHSFNGYERQWNIANNAKYIASIETGIIPFEHEVLNDTQCLNEYIMISLRTMYGCDLDKLHAEFDRAYVEELIGKAQVFIGRGWLEHTGNLLRTTQAGKLYADHIASELFIEEKK